MGSGIDRATVILQGSHGCHLGCPVYHGTGKQPHLPSHRREQLKSPEPTSHRHIHASEQWIFPPTAGSAPIESGGWSAISPNKEHGEGGECACVMCTLHPWTLSLTPPPHTTFVLTHASANKTPINLLQTCAEKMKSQAEGYGRNTNRADMARLTSN